MFKKLRNKIVIITMAITTAVLILAGTIIMLFSSTMRPEPKPFPNEPAMNVNEPMGPADSFEDYIKTDRKEGNTRLLITLVVVGATIEVLVFVISYYASKKMVEPVRDSYDKQKMFIANASHELKTPLAVIQANMEALEVAKGSEKWKDNIETEITYANRLVGDLLVLAKMDAGASRNVPEDVDLAKEIKNRAEIFEPKFGGKISLRLNKNSKKYLLPKQEILQVLDILFDNATKYGDKKVIVNLNENSVSVANDGVKIAKEDMAKIFDRFYQADKTNLGSGLGLAIAKMICEQNGWKIVCNSDKNLTEFSVLFKQR